MAVTARQENDPMTRCIVCGGITTPKFYKTAGTFAVDYCECDTCGHLTATGIDGKPDYGSESYFRDIDHGWELRHAKILQVLRLLTLLPGLGISSKSKVLDYGCGQGRLVASLAAAGMDAYGFEPYVDAYESSRVFRDMASVRQELLSVDLVALIEVLEHVRTPDDVMNDIATVMRPGGFLLLSTGIYERRYHDINWDYLNPLAGHVSIFSKDSLVRLLSQHDFFPLIRINEMMWVFRSRAGSWASRLKELPYYIVSTLRVMLKPSNLVRRRQ